jgi:hypothetical protein
VWERSRILAPIVLTAIGLVFFDGRRETTPGRVQARTGATAHLLAGSLGVTAEALSLSRGYEQPYVLMGIFVVVAFLAQTALGGAVRQHQGES